MSNPYFGVRALGLPQAEQLLTYGQDPEHVFFTYETPDPSDFAADISVDEGEEASLEEIENYERPNEGSAADLADLDSWGYSGDVVNTDEYGNAMDSFGRMAGAVGGPVGTLGFGLTGLARNLNGPFGVVEDFVGPLPSEYAPQRRSLQAEAAVKNAQYREENQLTGPTGILGSLVDMFSGLSSSDANEFDNSYSAETLDRMRDVAVGGKPDAPSSGDDQGFGDDFGGFDGGFDDGFRDDDFGGAKDRW